MSRHIFEREQFVPRPRTEVFGFFANAANLERLTPSALQFQIVTRLPIEMKIGTLIDYRLRLFGVPFRWRTLIEAFEPEDRFVDRQLRGPYRFWRHEHTFLDAPGGTLVKDRVEYEMPFGVLGAVARSMMVERTLDDIFDFRRQTVESAFA
ncbi:MAG TPA: SRPBCC family protein [Polyangiaceae bacterium]|nr:SRPBCC family protein [Polyangiaceae bacterium]